MEGVAVIKDILYYLQRHQSDILADLKTLVQSDSPTPDKYLVDQCGRVLTDLFSQRLGLNPEVISQTETGDHLRFTFGEGKKQLLIIGHFDTVWEEGRLSFRIDGNKVYGPGTIDMKGGLIQTIWALKACKELGIIPPKKIVVLCNGDHEGIASYTSRPYIEKEARRSEAVLVPEAAQGETGALKTERKGVLRYTITINGIAAHSGNNHQDGVSANVEMAKQILYLNEFTDYQAGTTVNIGVTQGGEGINVVPEYAEMKVDVRVKTMQEAQRMDQLIQNLAPINEHTTLQVHGGIVRPTMEKTQQTEHLFQLAKEAAAEIGMSLTQASVGGGSDGSFTAALGVPTLDGLGAAGEGPHAEHEHILMDQLPVRAALLARILTKL
ncbi:M20 family metallopeptidase [Salibacterium aidingense]|uniref:M20 family metallopeptidase n=1 Tax=Salibacterium aidingense TaxID=384933 RepID=UPI0003F637F2|nr:M20 family metallopeptidase [Salibacterium aidingense]